MCSRLHKGTHARIGAGAIGTAAVVLAVGASPAAATGSYPGETLSVTQVGPAVAGEVTHFTASGSQTDIGDYAGGFDLEVFAKNTSSDPTCSPTYPGEQQASVSDPYEQWIVVGEWQGSATTFDVPFQFLFPRTGQVILCAYSAFITDTAASASLIVNVTSSAPTPSRPRDVTRPRVIDSAGTLRCKRGTWTGATDFAFSWRSGGRTIPGAHRSRLRTTRAVMRRNVVCQVRASNTVGSTTVDSRAFHVP